MEKKTTIAGIKGTLSYDYDKMDRYPYTATFESEDKGTFHGYGNSKKGAIRSLEMNMENMVSQQ